jgi:hypothetical protein
MVPRPVTVTALVAVNSASVKPVAFPEVVTNGAVRTEVPKRITPKKAMTISREGCRNLLVLLTKNSQSPRSLAGRRFCTAFSSDHSTILLLQGELTEA